MLTNRLASGLCDEAQRMVLAHCDAVACDICVPAAVPAVHYPTVSLFGSPPR